MDKRDLLALITSEADDDLVTDVPSEITAPDRSREIVDDVPSAVAAEDSPEEVDSDFDGLTVTLRANFERLVETSAETNRELDDCRRQLQVDRETIRQLEEQLAQQTKVVGDLNAMFSEFMSRAETVGGEQTRKLKASDHDTAA